MNRITWRGLLAGAALAAGACSSSSGGNSGSASPTLTITASPTSIPNDGTPANLVVSVLTASGAAGTGSVTVSGNPGAVITYNGMSGNSLTAKLGSDGTVDPVSGVGLQYSCNASSMGNSSLCKPGSQLITLNWNGNTATTHITLTGASGASSSGSSGSTGATSGSSSSGGSTGSVTGDSCLNPLNTFTLFSVTPSSISIGGTAPATSTLTLLVQFPDGTAASTDSAGNTCNVSFSEAVGEHLISLSANSVPVAATGLATVTVAAGQQLGTAHVVASLGATQSDGGFVDFIQPIVITGQQQSTPDGGLENATIFVFSQSSPTISVAGGTQSSDTIVFQVDSNNSSQRTILPNVPVVFSQAASDVAVLSLGAQSGLTDAVGQASLVVTSGSIPGVAHVTATIPGTNPLVTTTATVTITTIPDAGQSLTGATLTATNVFPAQIVTQGFCPAGSGLSCSAVVTFTAVTTTGPVAGAPVSFNQAVGQSLVTLSSGAVLADGGPNLTVTTDSNGQASITVTSKLTSGVAEIDATLANAVSGRVTVPIVGGPSSINYIALSQTPTLLGIKGSNVNESGSMSFQLNDDLGNPVPSAQVQFSQAQPRLVNIVNPTAISDAAGQVTVSYSSGPQVGVTSITATVVSTGATASYPVAVRGAKPSAGGFSFRCDQANLPVYTTTRQLEQVTCHVALADRFGNRVGISVPVNFATEAGAITASATTVAFDPTQGGDQPLEGTVDVTFTSNFGPGGGPVDVAPLPADLNQFPIPRGAEPAISDGQLVRNPRDQLVTIIAMTQGEEEFIDSNGDGVLDNGEIFIDLSAPYIDANDDNAYDRVYQNGPFEKFFCATTNDAGTCDSFQGPNGKWDSNTTIWNTFWIVFTDVPQPTTIPANAWTVTGPTEDDTFPSETGTCLGGGASESAQVYAYDQWLNKGSVGTIYSILGTSDSAITDIPFGFSPNGDNTGAMTSGSLSTLSYYQVSEADGGLCASATGFDGGTPCINVLEFGGWDNGFRGTLNTTNGSVPATCTPTDGGQPFTAAVVCTPYDVTVSATAVSTATAEGTANGNFEFGTPCPP